MGLRCGYELSRAAWRGMQGVTISLFYREYISYIHMHFNKRESHWHMSPSPKCLAFNRPDSLGTWVCHLVQHRRQWQAGGRSVTAHDTARLRRGHGQSARGSSRCPRGGLEASFTTIHVGREPSRLLHRGRPPSRHSKEQSGRPWGTGTRTCPGSAAARRLDTATRKPFACPLP